ncbi:MAG: hypothetical protein ACE5HL_12460 [Terriglobia bacterium]
MDPLVLLEVVAVVAAWMLVLLTIRRWGPGRSRHWVRCPEKKRRAKVVVEYKESEFGRVRAVDVKDCSLLPDQPVDCDKECLTRL